MKVLNHLGVGLWTMQSTAAAPSNQTAGYRRFAEDCQLVEELGLHSVWTAEHRAWYDGWCPALIQAEAFAAARTSRLRFGNAMMLLPQHDPVALAGSISTLDRLTGGRLELGFGLGHRDAEFDALGVRRDRRGRLMDEALETMAEIWAAEADSGLSRTPAGPPVWIGGMSPAAVARAASRGHGLMLPQTLRPARLLAIAESYRSQAASPGPLGAMRDVWIEPDPGRAATFRARLKAHYREEVGSWWLLKGKVGFEQPAMLEPQLRRILDSALIGPSEEIAAGLNAMFAAGMQLLIVRQEFDFVEQAGLTEQLQRLVGEVAPLLDPPPAPSTARLGELSAP